jgi:alkylation response protein AidB-like acyl-CoA dehydrogenase
MLTRTSSDPAAWLAPDERELALAIADIAGTSPLERARAVGEGRGGLDRALIGRAGAAGLYGRIIGDETIANACIVAEQWGRTLAPEPWVETNTVIDTLSRAGSAPGREAIVSALVEGRRLASWASNDLPGYWGRGDAVRVAAVAGGFVLNGAMAAVPHADGVDWILVAARDAESVSHFLLPTASDGLSFALRDGLDITRPRSDVTLLDVHVDQDALIGARGGALSEIDRQVQLAIPLALSQTIGAMRAIVEVAIAHARSRIAFGRPIGSFQAVKHMLVDASLGIEMSAAMRDAAVRAVAGAQDDAAEIVSMAKAFVARTSIDVAHAAWQVFGGMAYMWEHDFHLYLRRLTADATFLGTEAWHNEHVVALHEKAK